MPLRSDGAWCSSDQGVSFFFKGHMKLRNSGNGRGLRAGIFEALENRLLFAFGQTDTTFGDAGHVTVSFSTQNATPAIQKILVDSSNKILAGGTTGLVRMSNTGVIDTTFGTSGKVSFPAGANFVSDAIDPTDGKIYVLVSASTGTGLFRYTSAGAVDSTYGQSGTVRVTSSTTFTPQALAVQSDGKVLVAGVFKTDSDNGREIRVYRLKTDGTTDTSFGSSGSEEFNFGSGTFLDPEVWDNVSGMAVLSSGKILIGGTTVDYAPEVDDPSFTPASYDKAQLAVARLSTNGTIDTTYGTSGIALTAYANSDVINSLGISGVEQGAFAVRSDGSALDAGNSNQAVIEELTSAGALKYETAASAGSQLNAPLSIAVLSDGRSVLLTQPQDITGVGFSMVAVSSTGVLSNVVFTSDNDPTTDDIDSSTDIGTLGVNSNGELLAGGSTGSDAASASDEFEIAEYKVGKATDPRPDQFPNARANDIYKDLEGGLHMAYYDASTTHLEYVYRAPNGLWNAPVTVDSSPDAGQYVSIAVNSKGNPGIAYFDGNAGDMKLAEFNGKKWVISDVDSKGSVGLYPSFTYDTSDEPVITYFNKTKARLTFALRNITTGKWGYENVDNSGDKVGRSSDLVASPNTGRYTVAYEDDTTLSVMWAAHQKGGVWQTKVAAKTKGGADFLSMQYSDFYEPAISYYDAFASDLKVTYFDPDVQTFTIKTLATSGAQGLYTQLFFGNSFSDPDVISYSKSADKLTLFSDSTISGTPTTTDIVTNGGKYLSADWNGTTLDLAYFDATVNGIIVRPGPTLTDLS